MPSKRRRGPRIIPGHLDLKADIAFAEQISDLLAAGEIAYLDAIRMLSRTVVARQPQRIADWVRKNLRAPAGKTGRPGPIRLTAQQSAICDLFQDPDVKRVTYIKNPRIGASFLIAAAMIYFAAHENRPVMFYDRAAKNARSFYEEKFQAIFEASPRIRGLLPDERNSIDRQRWTDRSLTTGAGIRFRSVSDKIKSDMAAKLFADEAGDPAYRNKGEKGEGSKVGLLLARVQEHPESTVFVGGTPTTLGDCTVSEEWERSNKCEWVMRFSCCGHEGEFVTDVREVRERGIPYGPGLRYTTGENGFHDAVWYECGHCHAEVHETEKVRLLKTGKWVPTALGEPGHVGVRTWMAHSQDEEATWGHIADAHIHSVQHPDKAQHFVNLWLARPWTPPVAKMLEIADLLQHVEDWGIYDGPSWGHFLFAGIDSQRGSETDPDKPPRTELVVYGIGLNMRRFVVGHWVIARQTTRIDGETVHAPIAPFSALAAEQIAAILKREFTMQDGRKLRVINTGCDVSYEMEQGIAFVKKLRSLGVRAEAVRGLSELAGRASAIGKDRETQSFVKSSMRVLKVGTQSMKDYLADTLAIPSPAPQSWAFPNDMTDHFYKDLLADHLVETKTGRQVWRKKDKQVTGEVLDCIVYGMAVEMMEREWTKYGKSVMTPTIRISRQSIEAAVEAAAAKVLAEKITLPRPASAPPPSKVAPHVPQPAVETPPEPDSPFEIIRDYDVAELEPMPKAKRRGFVIGGR